MLISLYDGPKEEENFHKLCEKANLRKDQYFIRNSYITEEKNFGLNISNRSGTLTNAEYKIPALKKSLNAICNYPAYTFFIAIMAMFRCVHMIGRKNML